MEKFDLNNTASGCTMYNGVLMTKKQIADLKKSTNKPKTKRAMHYTNEYSTIAAVTVKAVEHCSCIRQFQSYYDHGHRAWGKAFNAIVNEHKCIRCNFVSLRSLTYKINRQVSIIDNSGKKGLKETQYNILKLSWILDDYLVKINHLVNEIIASHVMDLYKDHEAINGVGKRLGLKILVERSSKSIQDLTELINSLQILSKDGDKALVRKYDAK